VLVRPNNVNENKVKQSPKFLKKSEALDKRYINNSLSSKEIPEELTMRCSQVSMSAT